MKKKQFKRNLIILLCVSVLVCGILVPVIINNSSKTSRSAKDVGFLFLVAGLLWYDGKVQEKDIEKEREALVEKGVPSDLLMFDIIYILDDLHSINSKFAISDKIGPYKKQDEKKYNNLVKAYDDLLEKILALSKSEIEKGGDETYVLYIEERKDELLQLKGIFIEMETALKHKDEIKIISFQKEIETRIREAIMRDYDDDY